MDECKEGKLALILGKGMEGVSGSDKSKWANVFCIGYGNGGRKDLFYGELMDGFWSPPQHMHY